MMAKAILRKLANMRAAPPVFIGMFIFGLAMAGFATAPGAAELPDIIKKVKPSIVGVGSYLELRRPPSQLLGTGFAVANGKFVVTNFHVVPQKIDVARREFLAVFVGTGSDAKVVRARLVAQDPAHDVAVLAIDGTALPAMTLDTKGDVLEGQSIAFTGFPIGAVLGLYPVTHRGIVSARTPIAIPQLTPKRLDPRMIKRLRQRFEVLQLDATAYPGNSGSPLYDQASGRVLGIVSSVFVKTSKENVLKDPSGITYAVPISYALALLREIGAVK